MGATFSHPSQNGFLGFGKRTVKTASLATLSLSPLKCSGSVAMPISRHPTAELPFKSMEAKIPSGTLRKHDQSLSDRILLVVAAKLFNVCFAELLILGNQQ